MKAQVFMNPNKKFRIQKLLSQLAVILFSPLLIIVAAVVAWSFSHPKRVVVKGNPASAGLDYEDVVFTSKMKDKALLKGWWIPTKSTDVKGTIVFSHGYQGNRLKHPRNIMALAQKFVEDGYHVFTYDFRNCGDSEGKMSTVGLYETYDLLGAIDYIKKNKDYQKLILMGWSTGAAVSIMAAGKFKKVDAVIADSPFYDLEVYLDENMPKWTKLPAFINPFVMFIIPLIAKGLHPRMCKPVEALKNIKCPIMFIHSKMDRFIPYTHSQKLFQDYQGKKEMWLTESGDHIKVHLAYDDYSDRTLSFLNKYIQKS